MKFTIVFAAVLAVSAAQFPGFDPSRVQYVRPTFAPPVPTPYRVSTLPPSVIANRGVNSDQNANIVRYDNEINPDGSYAYAYETDNGIAAQERGTPRNFGGNPPLIPVVAEGAFSFITPEGERIDTSYVADENGYQPSGNAIPTPPPIPEAILRSLEYIARNAPQQIKK